ncbi:MAG: hypothetical protein JWP01_3994 [Myxococcales bacterium]|nr:hypothetical protein [Myxococcales bacterium]
MKLVSWVVIGGLGGCVVNNKPVPVGPFGPQTGGTGGGSVAAAPTAGCFAGTWKGRGEDVNHRNSSWQITFAQEGGALRGTFDWVFEFSKVGTEQVTGTVDCAAGTAELQGGAVTGDAGPARYKLKLMTASSQPKIEGTWECDAPCTGGTVTGYLQ